MRKKIKQSKIRAINLKVLFHYYKHHKYEMTAFWLWFISRYILDNQGTGYVDLKKLNRLAQLKPDYAIRICQKSELFRAIHDNRLYYTSIRGVYSKHRLKLTGSYLRGELISKIFIKTIRNQTAFKGYICKCYAEMDLDKKYRYKITKGRIGHQAIAKFFDINRKTVITNLNLAKAKSKKNIRHFKSIKFIYAFEFGTWLLHNMDTRLGGHFRNTKAGGHIIENNPNSYFVKKNNTGRGYYLIQVMPNIYRFTGVFFTRVRGHRGNRK